MIGLKCGVCGDSFVSRKGTKYCSSKCRQKNLDDSHREDRRAYHKKYSKDERLKCNNRLARWVEKNRSKVNNLAIKYSSKARKNLTDSYIKKLFQHHCRAADVTNELILQKRESIKLKRLIHEKSRQVNAH